MSGTDSAPPGPNQRGAVITSVVGQVTFLGALTFSGWLAWTQKDAASIALFTALCGAASTNATTIIGFWVGSAHGSQAKDGTIANLALKSTPPTGTTP